MHNSQPEAWYNKAAAFLGSLSERPGRPCSSRPGGAVTLYGTCYAHFGLFYLGHNAEVSEHVRQFVVHSQDSATGFMIGPELSRYRPDASVYHTRQHLIMHSTCAALPFCQEFGIPLQYPLKGAHPFCDTQVLADWLRSRDWKHAWREGNDLLFVGQLLVYLRDIEKHPGAAEALKSWFAFLDEQVDPATGAWGTDGKCSPEHAVYGGYHQLLVYYHEKHPVCAPQRLVDTVLRLQHRDGGFSPGGNAGACEDVDCVDILVNLYKRINYRRADIALALRRCLKHILLTQNTDGGFPYSRNQQQSHMGIPDTEAGPNISCAFPTWFRIHTLALIAQVLPDEPELAAVPFRFNTWLSMGWHRSPDGWKPMGVSRVKLAAAWLSHQEKQIRQVPLRLVRTLKTLKRHLVNFLPQ